MVSVITSKCSFLPAEIFSNQTNCFYNGLAKEHLLWSRTHSTREGSSCWGGWSWSGTCAGMVAVCADVGKQSKSDTMCSGGRGKCTWKLINFFQELFNVIIFKKKKLMIWDGFFYKEHLQNDEERAEIQLWFFIPLLQWNWPF